MDLGQLQKQAADHLMSTQFVKAIMKGQATREQYRAYLLDVYAYAQHSAPVIGYAASRLASSHPKLAEYLFHHATEELCHDQWAAADLRELGATVQELTSPEPSSACLRMIGLEYFYALHANPVGLFGWMFVLESHGGAAGSGIASALDRSLRLDGKGTHFLREHGEADLHHSEDLYRIISENITQPSDIAIFARMAQESDELYCRIIDSAFQLKSAYAPSATS